jgi:hypothetical protein
LTLFGWGISLLGWRCCSVVVRSGFNFQFLRCRRRYIGELKLMTCQSRFASKNVASSKTKNDSIINHRILASNEPVAITAVSCLVVLQRGRRVSLKALELLYRIGVNSASLDDFLPIDSVKKEG